MPTLTDNRSRLRWARVALLLSLAPLPCAAAGADSTTTFIAVGDAPYCVRAEEPFAALMKGLRDAAKPAFVVHVGDVQGSGKDEPCSRAPARVDSLAALVGQRLLFAPGDNDWRDCSPNGHRDEGALFKASIAQLAAAAVRGASALEP